MFVGRDIELKQLRAEFERPGGSLTVVYGRRRAGKSALIQEAARGYRYFSFEGLEGQSKSKQIKYIAHELSRLGVPVPASPREWFEILPLLLHLVSTKEPTIIVLDEFQWLANYRNEIVSELKAVWDRELMHRSNLKLVLCGSVASFMVKKVLRSKALYGRAHLSIHLKPFILSEARQLLVNCGVDEVLLAYEYVGGIPQYLDLLTDRSSVLLSLAFHLDSTTSYFVTEFQKIFISQFGSSPVHQQVVRALAGRVMGLSRRELVEETSLPNSGFLSAALEDLELSGMVTAYTPYDQPKGVRSRRYLLTDRYLDLYLTMIEPLVATGEINRTNFIDQVHQTPKMRSWLGRGLEMVCLQHAPVIARLLGFSAVRYQVGPYFRNNARGAIQGAQFDLVFDRADKVTTVCEIKRLETPVPLSVGKEFSERVNEVFDQSKRSIQKVLISTTPATKELVNSHHFNTVLLMEQIIKG